MNYWHRQTRRNEVYECGVSIVVPGFEGWTFTVRPLTVWNTHYKTAAMRIASADPDVKAYLERVGEKGYVSTDADRALDARMNRDAIAEGCVTAWTGVTDRDDEFMPFCIENVLSVFDFFPALFAYLDAFVRDERNFPALSDDEKAEIASGNFAPASSSRAERGGKRSKH